LTLPSWLEAITNDNTTITRGKPEVKKMFKIERVKSAILYSPRNGPFSSENVKLEIFSVLPALLTQGK